MAKKLRITRKANEPPVDAAVVAPLAFTEGEGFAGVNHPRFELRRRSLLATLATAFALAAFGGAAWAYFTSTGSGAGTSSTGTMQTVTVAALASDVPGTRLLPGSSGEVILRVHNPNPTQATLTAVVATPSSVITVTGGSGCTLGNSGVSYTNQNGLSIPIPAGAGSTLVRLTGAALMSTSSANGCQGATFSIPVTITVRWP